MARRYDKLVAGGLGLAILVLALAGAASYRAAGYASQAVAHQTRGRDMLTQLEDIFSDVTDAERARRGFILTGEETYLAPYYDCKRVIDRKLAALRGARGNRAGDATRFEELSTLIHQRLENIDDSIQRKRAPATTNDQAVQVKLTDEGRELTDQIRKRIAALTAEEVDSLGHWDAEAAARFRRSNRLIVFGSVFALVMVSASTGLVFAEIRQRRRAERLLLLSHAELEQRVEARTAELHSANDALKNEIADRKAIEQRLQEHADQLHVLSSRLFDAQENTRREIARELHDEIGQTLTAVKVNLQALRLAPEADRAAKLAESIGIVDQAIAGVRSLSLDLRPPTLDDLGLAAALRWHLDRESRRAGYAAKLSTNLDQQRLGSQLETACFRVAQEALTNIARHAHAHQVTVRLQLDSETVSLSVRDDGAGFDVPTAWCRARVAASLGLLGMKERVELLGGTFDIISAPSGGTEVRAAFPRTTAAGPSPHRPEQLA